jgi:class 3 adenylate cyclase
MLASMSEIDRRADAPLVDWSDLGVSGLLPTGTVTLLLADVEGSTQLWETQPEEMAAAIARLNQVVSDVIATHDGVRPVEQGEGDSFVAAFARASDAVAAALELQLAPLAPIRRIGVHTGEIQLRDEGNYAGPTINRTAWLRDLARAGSAPSLVVSSSCRWTAVKPHRGTAAINSSCVRSDSSTLLTRSPPGSRLRNCGPDRRVPKLIANPTHTTLARP